MGWTKKVVDGLDGIERTDRHLYEHRVPVAHRSVPESGKFECLYLHALTALDGDEACRLIHKLRKVELVPLPVFRADHEVYRIEVGSLLQHLHRLLVVGVDLCRLKDLWADRAVGIVGEERTAAGLALVLHHHRTRGTDG